MFKNIEKVIRQNGNLRIEEARYGNDIIVCIDILTCVNNATDESDGTLCYTGTEIYDAVNIMTSPCDMEAVDAEERLDSFAKEHPEFLYAKGSTLSDAIEKLEERALLWNNLKHGHRITSDEQDKILLDFVATETKYQDQTVKTIPGQMRVVNTDMKMEEE